jgi:predicted transposase YbfD/YdcC
VASICGAESCVDFADFGRDRAALFREFLRLEGGLPSHDTFSRVFRLLDPAAFATSFGRFLEGLGAAGKGVLAIDGKTLRRSFDRAAGGSPLHVVTAFACERRLVLGQAAVAAGENEIIAARALLDLLDLGGMLVTGDAIHCQADTAALIARKGGNWLFALKANWPATLAEVERFFADPPPGTVTEAMTTDADHGRIETRRHRVSHQVDWLFSERRYAGETQLPGLATLAMVEAETERDGQRTLSRRYYVSSARLAADAFAAAVRAHWRIENSLHWVLDVGFDEDRARNRKDHGPENLAILRKLALNVLRAARPDISIRRKRKRSGWSDEFARTVIGQMR